MRRKAKVSFPFLVEGPTTYSTTRHIAVCAEPKHDQSLPESQPTPPVSEDETNRDIRGCRTEMSEDTTWLESLAEFQEPWSNFSGNHTVPSNVPSKDSSSSNRNDQAGEPSPTADPSSSTATAQGQGRGEGISPPESSSALIQAPGRPNSQIDRFAVRVGTSDLPLVTFV